MKLYCMENYWLNFCLVSCLLPSLLLYELIFGSLLQFQDSDELMNMIISYLGNHAEFTSLETVEK